MDIAPIAVLSMVYETLLDRDTWIDILKEDRHSFRAQYEIRNRHITTCGFPIVTSEIVDRLAQFIGDRRVLDVGAGTGYLSYHLKQAGCQNIVAVDSYETTYGSSNSCFKKYPHVTAGDALEYVSSDFDIVIMSWPDYETPFAYDVASKMSMGQILIYQGEGHSGCTGSDEFHQLLDTDFSDLEELNDSLYALHVRFSGIHDNWNCYIKK